MFQFRQHMHDKKLFVLAGELSGDLHASEVIRVLKTQCPGLRIFGAGGRRISAHGADLLYRTEELSVMGFAEVVKQGFFLRRVIRDLKQAVARERPDAALLVDYPGMNLVFAGFLHRLGIPVIYYIPPKVWAWKEGRVRKIRKYVDHLMVIFDFEVDFYLEHGIDAEFAGNPVAEEIRGVQLPARSDFLGRHAIDENRKIIGLLPGSRKQEITMIFPEMLRAARKIQDSHDAVFLLGKAPDVAEGIYEAIAKEAGIPLTSCPAYEVMRYSDLLLVTSGTATLEALCFGTPMIVLYKTGWFNYAIGKRLVRLHSISLANLVAKGLITEERAVPELLQGEANAERIFSEASSLLGNDAAAETMREELLAAKETLGSVSPSQKVASVILQYLQT